MSAETELALGPDWSDLTSFRESAEIGGVRVELAGYSAVHRSGHLVTGSAASLAGCPRRRAFWELLERTSLVEAAQGSPTLELMSERKEPRGVVDRLTVFPADRPFHHSLSNGAAGGHTFRDACRRARLELIERDRVLRSWHGYGKPQALGAASLLPEPWFELYSFHAARLPASDATNSPVEVCVLAALPRQHGVPFACGFGAGVSLDLAMTAAKREVVQGIGFLWGEELPQQPPTVEASPAFHQAWYLYPGHHARILAWLRGAHTFSPDTLVENLGLTQPGFVNLTPPHLQGRFWVVKALPTSELSLTFGVLHPHLASTECAVRRVHPVA